MLTVEQVSTLSVHLLNTTSVQSILSTAILATRLPVLSYEHSVKCLWINVFNISSCFQHWSLIDVWTVSNIFLQVPINFPFGFTCSASNRAAGFEKYHHTVTYTGEKNLKRLHMWSHVCFILMCICIQNNSYFLSSWNGLLWLSYNVQLKAIRDYIPIPETQTASVS